MRGEAGERGGEQRLGGQGKGLRGEMKPHGLLDAVLPRISQHHSSLCHPAAGEGASSVVLVGKLSHGEMGSSPKADVRRPPGLQACSPRAASQGLGCSWRAL